MVSRRHFSALLVTAAIVAAVVAIASACTSSDEGGSDGSPTILSDGSAVASDDTLSAGDADCGAPDYPCSRDEVDPAVHAQEDDYVNELLQRLDRGSRDDALAWIQTQERVVASFADLTMMAFRLEGGQPVVLLEPLSSGTGAPNARSDAGSSLVRFEASKADHPEPVRPGGVVGAGTSRDNPQNRKRALFLTPYEWQGLSMFTAAGPDPVSLLREIPDYNHDPGDVVHLRDEAVTPAAMADWGDYDAIFFETHGGQSKIFGTWLALGVKQPWQTGTDSYNGICRKLMAPYRGTPGLGCNVLTDRDTGAKYVNLGLHPWFFKENYGQFGGLEKAIVYIGGCLTLTVPDVAGHLAGSSSAYLGWSSTVYFDKEGDAASSLLFFLAQEANGGRKTVAGALKTLCDNNSCGGPGFSPSGRTSLQLHDNGDEPSRLRLYDLPTPRDPRSPISSGPGLQDGAQLQIKGAAGDGENDKLELVVDFIGIVDPNDSSGSLVSFAQSGDPKELYNFRVLLGDGEQEIGADNLGRVQHPEASVSQLGDTTHRYHFTAQLPFDVPEDGKNTSLKVIVDLPEGGESKYEVDVTLIGARSVCDVVTPASGRLADAFGTGVPLEKVVKVHRDYCQLNLKGEAPHPQEGFSVEISPLLIFQQEPAIVTTVDFAIRGTNNGSPEPAPSLGDQAVSIFHPFGDDVSVYFDFEGRIYSVQGGNGWGYLEPTSAASVIAVAEVLLELLGGPAAP